VSHGGRKPYILKKVIVKREKKGSIFMTQDVAQNSRRILQKKQARGGGIRIHKRNKREKVGKGGGEDMMEGEIRRY